MTSLLSGKVALVTGVSRVGQVGQAVAKALAAEGVVLGIAARSRDHVEARAAELGATGPVSCLWPRILRTKLKCSARWTG